jgi:hypothetical protein
MGGDIHEHEERVEARQEEGRARQEEAASKEHGWMGHVLFILFWVAFFNRDLPCMVCIGFFLIILVNKPRGAVVGPDWVADGVKKCHLVTFLS